MNFVTNPALKSWAYLNIGIFMSMINGRRGMTAVLESILPNTQADKLKTIDWYTDVAINPHGTD